MVTAPEKSRSTGTSGTGRPPRSREQLRRDRIVTAMIIIFFAVMVALIAWLASLGGGQPDGGGYDYFLML